MKTLEVRTAISFINDCIQYADYLEKQMPCDFKVDLQKMSCHLRTANMFLKIFLKLNSLDTDGRE